jgi:hypothetical protein
MNKRNIKNWVYVGLLLGLPFLATRGCSMIYNNRDIETPTQHQISYATGIFGHREYVAHNDGSTELKIYPSYLGHRLGASIFYQDLDGDGKVDRIRESGGEITMNNLKTSLVRQLDYEANKEIFDEADKILAKEKDKHSKN